MNSNIAPAILRPRQVAEYLGVSIATVWRYLRLDHNFPKAIKLGSNTTGIMRADLDAWLQQKKGGK